MAEEDEITNTTIQDLERELEIKNLLNSANQEGLRDLTSRIEGMESLGVLNERQQADLDRLLTSKQGLVEEMVEEARLYKEIQERIAAVNKKMSEMRDIGKTAASNLRDLSRAFGVPKNFEKSLTGSILKLGMLSDKTEEGQEALKEFKKEMGKGFSAGNIAMSVMGTVVTAMQDAALFLFKNLKDVAISFDEMRANINKSVLSAGAYVVIAKQASIENMQLGVTAEVAGDATIAIAKNMDLASDASKVFAKELGGTVSKMSVLGADASQTTKILSFFQRGLKQTAARTKGTTMEVFKLAKGLKTDLSTAFDQLSQAMPTLAAHGDRMMEVFKDMAAQARASGASIQTLLSVAGKFDQFSSGAQAAAALNSLLGGALLNSTELLRMSESERLETIISTIQAQGLAFKDMDRFKQKAIANAVGITDMAEANKLFGMSMTEYEGYVNQVDKAAASQRALDEATAKALPVLQSLQLAVSEFVAEYGDLIQDVLDGTLDIVKSFTKWKKEGADMWSGWGAVVTGVVGSVVLVMGTMLAMTIKIGFAMGGLATAAGGVATSLAAIAAAGGGAAAVGGTAAAVGGGAAAAAGGTALLPILAGIALVAGAVYGASKLFEGNERTTETAKAEQATAARERSLPPRPQPESYTVDTATLNLSFSAEETVRISKALTNIGLKANGMS